MGEVKKVPKLRFNEFSGEWTLSRLEDLFIEFRSGQGIIAADISEDGKYPVFGGNGLRGYSENYTHEGNYFLIGRQGALCGNINRAFGKSYISEHAIACLGNEESSTDFLAHRLEYLNLNRLSESSAQPGLSVKKLLRLKLIVPTLPEQEKIANFLTAVDTKISNLSEEKSLLEQYKKGAMQQIFSQELRFKNDDGSDFPEWENKRLGEVCDVRDGTHESPKYLSQGYPLITSKNLLRNGEIDLANVNLISKADYIDFNKRSNVSSGDILFGMIGTIGNPVIVQEDNFAIKNVALIKEIYVLKNYYLIHLLKSSYITKQFHKQNTGGTQKFIALGVIRMLYVLVPVIEEQTKIANFLSAIDDKITTISEAFEGAQAFKKGLLQQLFV